MCVYTCMGAGGKISKSKNLELATVNVHQIWPDVGPLPGGRHTKFVPQIDPVIPICGPKCQFGKKIPQGRPLHGGGHGEA